MARETFPARLLQKVCLSESAQCYHFEFEMVDRASFEYKAGQFLSAVAVDGNGKTQTRAYSIASAAQGTRFNLCVNRVEGGFFSNYLADLAVDSVIQIHGPHGHFVLHQPPVDAIFVATGTGIAPMRAFTQELFPETGAEAGADRSGGREIWCVYGTRHESELYYREYFEQVAAKHANFHYVTTLSRAPQEWKGNRGYVQQYVGQIVKAREVASGSAGLGSTALGQTQAEGAPPEFGVYTYICGLNNMVSEVRNLLAEHGWDKKQVIFERYD